MAGYATAHVKYLNSCFISVRLGFLWTKDE